MRRSPRVLLAWIAAFAVALTTARVVGGDLATLHRRAASLGPTHTVVVATRDLTLGHTIGTADVRTVSRYASEIPRDAIADARAARGRVVVVPVLRDAIVFTHHLAAANRSGLDGVVPISSVEGVAFAFPDSGTVYRAMDGDLGKLVRDAFFSKGLVCIDRVCEAGFRHFTTATTPIRRVEDLEGLRLRVPAGRLVFDTFRSLGASIERV